MEHKIIITPETALIDEKVEIVLEGFEPDQRVTLKASMDNLLGMSSKWISQATFIAGADGCINIAEQAPVSGSYTGVDAMGLFWSMKANKSPKLKKTGSLKDIELFPASIVKLSAEVDGIEKAATTCSRLYAAPQVTTRDVTDEGFIGRFFYNPASGPRPAMIVVGGSDSSLEYAQAIASLLASHGFTALALAYFGINNLPPLLSSIPLEYFRTALNWLQAQPETNPYQMGIWGRSKGGELALLLGSRFREIKAVLAHTPSALVFQELGKGFTPASTTPWTWLGKPLPYIKLKVNLPAFQTKTMFKMTFGRQVRFDKVYLESLQNIKPDNSSFIPAERTSGPIMLVSAQDDAIWPSALFCNMITQRLEQKGFKYQVTHLNYENTGHNISPPYLPTTTPRMNGGQPAENAFAAEDSWHKALDFFKTNLQATNPVNGTQPATTAKSDSR
jgi:dienelactone hydrolase